MDDNSSTASFEEIRPPASGFKFESTEDRNIEKLKALVVRTAAGGGAARELAEDEVPDVAYVLQYKGWGGKLTEVRRSHEPIDIEFDEAEEESTANGKKPVLEIVTVVSTSYVKKNRMARNRMRAVPPPPLPGYSRPPIYDDYGYDEYGRRRNNYGHGNSDEEMKVAKLEKTAMIINSTHLINALKAVVGYSPGSSFFGNSVKVMAPYRVLVHHRAALARYKVSQPESHVDEYAFTTAKHIDVLLAFLEKTLGEEIREEESRHNKGTPAATFDKLWLLLKPGEVVYAKHDNRWTAFVVSSVHDNPSDPNDGASYTVECWNISYVGDRLCRSMQSFNIGSFSGEEAITSLPVVPARFFRGENGDTAPSDVSARQIRLGKTVWGLAKGPSYWSYDGSLVEKSPEYNRNHAASPTGYMSGRVIVDCEGHARYSMMCPGRHRNRGMGINVQPGPPPPKDQLPYFAPRCGCSACNRDGPNEDVSPFAEFEDLNPTRDAAPASDLYYLVLTKVVAGFILGDRRWGHFNVEDLRDVEFDKEAFRYLVLDDEIKATVKALIGKFASTNGQVAPWPNDFVKNKGQGRIFLLHGSPGVGKTCTAECVAELTHRPLLSLTSGDLSTNSYTVERNLEYFLQLGERFGAMVLLDEADVYLEARRTRDIARNGLVSIFLRALEYYRGVLFLTTNRVQTFDSAFTSRIHVALHYQALTDADRERIWLNSFERLGRDSAGRVHVGVATREYAYESRDVRGLRWNGREIRNALQTAVALAETEALEDGAGTVTVTDKHLRSVVKMSRGFKNFLRKRRLRDESDFDDDDYEEEEEEEEEEVPPSDDDDAPSIDGDNVIYD